jgi:hypothetical protein
LLDREQQPGKFTRPGGGGQSSLGNRLLDEAGRA